MEFVLVNLHIRAISASRAAVDSVVEDVYKAHGLGAPGDDSFQQKVNKSLTAKDAWSKLEKDLVELGWAKDVAERLCLNLKGSGGLF